jgi:hypothetical protein
MKGSRDSSCVNSVRAARTGFDSQRGRIFSAVAMSRLVLGFTQPLDRWVPGVNGRGVRLTTHLHLMSVLRMRGAIPPARRSRSYAPRHKAAFILRCSDDL